VRILFLSQRVPYPPNRGDKITTWRLVDRMRRSHEVRCMAFAHGPADLRAAAELSELGVPIRSFPHDARWAQLKALPLLLTRRALTLGVYGSRSLQAAVDEAVGDCDLAYAYSSSMGAFLLPHPGVTRVMHFAELDSDKWRQYAERTRPPMSWVYRREWRTLLAFERELAHAFDQNVFCTPLEERIFREQVPGAPSTVLRNGVDAAHFTPAPEAAEPGHLVFTGVMDYYPNVDGCRWFAEAVLPGVRARFPDARFTIVGAHPVREVRALAELPGVEVTGFVEDTRDWLRRAAVAVAPLRIARGIQNKVLESMAMGLPVVGTTCATQGTEAVPGEHLLVADDEQGLIEAVCSLLGAPDDARELGRAGRRYVEEHYDWEVVLRDLDRILECGRAPAETSHEPREAS